MHNLKSCWLQSVIFLCKMSCDTEQSKDRKCGHTSKKCCVPLFYVYVRSDVSMCSCMLYFTCWCVFMFLICCFPYCYGCPIMWSADILFCWYLYSFLGMRPQAVFYTKMCLFLINTLVFWKLRSRRGCTVVSSNL